MRTIKFKGKSIDSSEWIEGYYYKECGHTYIIEDKQKDSLLNRNKAVLIDPSTVCQFTGFHDKNGYEIYEGDVLRSDEYPFSCAQDGKRDNYFGIVFYDEESAAFGMKSVKNPKARVIGIYDDVYDEITQEKLIDFEVIGNIHEDEWKQYGKYFQDKEEKEDKK